MAQYRYRAIAADGRKTRGSILAESEADAAARLRQQGLQPFSLRAARWREGTFGLRSEGPGRRRREVWIATRGLAALLRAGLPLAQTLESLIEEQEDPGLREVLADCRAQVVAGRSLADALAAHPQWFDSLFVRLVRAGEMAGALETVLARLAEEMRAREQLAGRLRNALAYPLFLVVVGVAAVAFLMLRVVPTILTMLEDLGQAIPAPTRMLQAAVTVLRVGALPAAGLAFAAAAALRLALRDPARRIRWDRLRLRWPLVGPVWRAAAASRFARTLASLLEAGVPLLPALRTARGMAGNAAIEDALARAEAAVERGEPLSGGLMGGRLFPPALGHLVRAGEAGGELPRMLDEAASLFEQDVQRRTERITTLLEPMLVAVLGGVVLLIVLAILVPIFEMNQATGL